MADNAFNARVRELLSAAMQLALEKPEIVGNEVADYWANTSLDVLVEHIGESTFPAVRRLCADLEWSVDDMLKAMGPLEKEPGEYIILVEDLDDGHFWSYVGSSKDMEKRCSHGHALKSLRDAEQNRPNNPSGKYLYNVIDQPGKRRKIHLGSLAIFDRAVFAKHPVLKFTAEGLFQLMLRTDDHRSAKYRSWLDLPGVGIPNKNVTGTCQSVPFFEYMAMFSRAVVTGLPRHIVLDTHTWSLRYSNADISIMEDDRAALEAWGMEVGDTVTLRFDIAATPEQQKYPWIHTRIPPPGLDRASLLGMHLSGTVKKANNLLEPGDEWSIWIRNRRLRYNDETRVAQAAMSFIEHVEGTYVLRPDRLNLTYDARQEPMAPISTTPEEREAQARALQVKHCRLRKEFRESLAPVEKAALNKQEAEAAVRRRAAYTPEKKQRHLELKRANYAKNKVNKNKPPETAEERKERLSEGREERLSKGREDRRNLYANETPEQAAKRKAKYKEAHAHRAAKKAKTS